MFTLAVLLINPERAMVTIQRNFCIRGTKDEAQTENCRCATKPGGTGLLADLWQEGGGREVYHAAKLESGRERREAQTSGRGYTTKY
jgi:hypothetical protein